MLCCKQARPIRRMLRRGRVVRLREADNERNEMGSVELVSVCPLYGAKIRRHSGPARAANVGG